jgi:hypothetical protein
VAMKEGDENCCSCYVSRRGSNGNFPVILNKIRHILHYEHNRTGELTVDSCKYIITYPSRMLHQSAQ